MPVTSFVSNMQSSYASGKQAFMAVSLVNNFIVCQWFFFDILFVICCNVQFFLFFFVVLVSTIN
jgi:hypothetical protein